MATLVQWDAITGEDVKIHFSEIQKVNVFQDPFLNEITWGNCDIKITKEKSVTDASMWVMFISKNSNTGQLISLTNPIHRIPGYFVNKPMIKALLW